MDYESFLEYQPLSFVLFSPAWFPQYHAERILGSFPIANATIISCNCQFAMINRKKDAARKRKLLTESSSAAYTLVNRDFFMGTPPPPFQPGLEQAGLFHFC